MNIFQTLEMSRRHIIAMDQAMEESECTFFFKASTNICLGVINEQLTNIKCEATNEDILQMIEELKTKLI